MPKLTETLDYHQQLLILENLSGNHGVQLTFKSPSWWTVFIGYIEILLDDGQSRTIDEDGDIGGHEPETAVRLLLDLLTDDILVNSAVFRVFAPESWQVPEPQSVTRFDGKNFVEVNQNSRLWSIPSGFREIPIHTR